MALTTMYNGQVNSPQTALNGAINSSVTSITVVDGTILPPAPMPLVISEGTKEPETVLMTNKVGNVLTVTRAFQGVAQSWSHGASIGRNFTAYDYNTLVENATTINNDLDAHKADGTNIKHKAKVIELDDTGGNFIATNVEGAMGELFQYVSNGKQLIATAITDKEVPTSSSDSFQTMADNIGEISGGYPIATGESSSSIVSGLGFTPTHVFVHVKDSLGARDRVPAAVKTPTEEWYIYGSTLNEGNEITFNSDGFSVNLMKPPFLWIAVAI